VATAEVEKIRRLLREANEAAQRIGDEPLLEPAGVGYFPTDDGGGLEAAIDQIARYPGDITMFVGAGVSTESELPSWNGLIRQLLLDAETGAELDDGDRDLWIEAVVSQGPLAAAAIARAHYPDDIAFRQALRAALYGGRAPDDFVPGALAGQIAWLKQELGPRLRLVTANYDGLLERALEEVGLDPVAYVQNRGEPEGKAAVWHLHGRLMKTRSGTGWARVGRLVLTEGDYALSTSQTWPEGFVAGCLADSLCVFVGLSMTDPNFIRWLYRYVNPDSRHVAVFVRQASSVPNEAVRKGLEESAAARWEMAGVKPIWSNYFGEVAQFVHEIGLRIADPESPRFSDRAAERLRAARASLDPVDARSFVEAQQELSEWLLDQVAVVKMISADLRVDLSAEDLGLGLWVANHAEGVAELWGTSEQVWLDRNAVEQRPMHAGSRWVGVAAMVRGVPVEQDPAVYTTRWRFIRGIPVVVHAPDRSLVGSLTLTSATPLGECPLSIARAPRELLLAIDQFLGDAAAEFFGIRRP
jgi:hypothetical protein